MMNFRKAAALSMAIMLGAAGAVSVSAANPESAAEAVSTAEAPAEEGFVVITNQYFGVTVPVSLCDLMDIVSTNNGIKFYQKSARETCGGFIGEIMVFENLKEYKDIPHYERGGEIRYPDGSKLDVVLEYPSDVQADISSEESMQEYSDLVTEFGKIASGLTPLKEGTFVPQSEVDTSAVYQGVITKIVNDLRERKDKDALIADGFSDIYTYIYNLEDKDPLNEIGYAFVDVNHDGYAELLIGSVGDPTIYDMFTNVDGEAKQVLTSGERNTYVLSDNGGVDKLIRNDGSDSAFRSFTNFLALPSDSNELGFQTGFIYDAEKDKDQPFFITYDKDAADAEGVDEKEFTERMNDFGTVFDPGFRPLSELL